MTKFHDKLIDLLKSDSRFVDEEGELVTAAVIDRAWKIDRELVKFLLSVPEIKEKFFDEIEGHWIFNINTFIEYVSDKNFLANSYTRFRNKIGLNIDGKFLRERGEVSLVWPYKECVLEGGQTKEEEKRKEIFFNEILAQDEIDRLFEPKVLTGWKRYTVDKEKDVSEIKRDETGTIRENLIIKGNNLIALHTLKKQFRGKVKLIYIDPPYNTGGDGFRYNDSFSHSAWLTFMKNRLEISLELLSKEGAIFVNIDDNEAHYCKILFDDIFGRDNFLANIIWQKIFSPKNTAHHFSTDHDHILVFAKQAQAWRPNPLERTDKYKELYKNPDNDPRGTWTSGDLSARNYYGAGTYEVKTPSGRILKGPPKGTYWRVSKDRMQELDRDGRIWWGNDGNNVPRLKRYLSEVKEGIVPQTLWYHKDVGNTQEAKKEVNKFSDAEIFTTPKPERLIQRIVHIGSKEGDIVLDFFAGSATTAAVAHKMKRQWITVEQMDYVENITLTRLKKVIGQKVKKSGNLTEVLEYDQGGVSKSVNWQGGGDFIYCELMKYNEAFMNKIQAAKSSEELISLWKDIAATSFLNWYVNPEMPEEAVNDFIKIGKSENGLDKQKKLLAELLNKNQLYVNLSEIEDQDFNVSEEDKKLNRLFYGESI